MSKFGISNVLNQSNRDGRISTKPNSKGEFTNNVNISTSERYDVSLSADQQANVSRWVFIWVQMNNLMIISKLILIWKIQDILVWWLKVLQEIVDLIASLVTNKDVEILSPVEDSQHPLEVP